LNIPVSRSEPDETGGDQLIQDIFGASDEEEEFEVIYLL